MLVYLQFDSIGRRKRQNGRLGTRQVQCTSASHSIPDDVAAAHSDYETRDGAHNRRVGRRRARVVPALEVFDPSAVCPLRHKGLLCSGADGSSVRSRANRKLDLRGVAEVASGRLLPINAPGSGNPLGRMVASGQFRSIYGNIPPL